MFGLKFFVWFTLTAPLVAASVEFNRDIRPFCPTNAIPAMARMRASGCQAAPRQRAGCKSGLRRTLRDQARKSGAK